MAGDTGLHARYMEVKQGRHWRTWPLVRHLRSLQFRRLQPFNKGADNGLSVIRYYWADFLDQHRADVRGLALEVGGTGTIREYGGDQLVRADALDLSAHSPDVRVVADLSRADHVQSDGYDCILIQFSTAVIYDIEAALYHSVRLLKPGGVLLINFWCVDFYLHRGLDMGTGEPLYMVHWATPIQVQNWLRGLALNEDDFSLTIYGNLLTRMAFLMNAPAHEFTQAELNHYDPGQPLLICTRIMKPADWSPTKPPYVELGWTPDIAPAQLRKETGHYGDEYL